MIGKYRQPEDVSALQIVAGEAPGAAYLGRGRTRFCVWAPFHERFSVHLLSPEDTLVDLEPSGGGYHEVIAEAAPGTRYKLRLPDGRELPDPASRYQPHGVHGPSEVVDTDFGWTDSGWRGIELRDYVLYELHVGTFSEDGTFAGVADHLDELRDLGVTAIELMPVAQFPGERNWGYDGVGLYAVQNSYGGPDGLRRLVDAAHSRGLAVVLDVVYNHLGPEGNHLGEFGPYFTDRYSTVWGPAINYDGEESDEVRRFFIENALMWVRDYHIDALRLDAVHAIIDHSARPFLQELADAVHAEGERLGRHVYTMPETDLNDPRLVRPPAQGGFGLDAQWNDDFHHALHSLLTGERDGYYADYGRVSQLATCLRRAYAIAGEYSEFRKRRHGAEPVGLSGEKFIVFSQNHDQVGNRMLGERLTELVGPDALKLAAGAVLLSPFIPLLFMGEEYCEPAPFLYFVSHGDEELLEAVRNGRAEEFASFGWTAEPPDPGAETTFRASRLNHELKGERGHAQQLAMYRELLRLRRETPALANLSLEEIEVQEDDAERTLLVRRWTGDSEALIAFNFGQREARIAAPGGARLKLFDSQDRRWGGAREQAPATLGPQAGPLALPPRSFVVYGPAA